MLGLTVLIRHARYTTPHPYVLCLPYLRCTSLSMVPGARESWVKEFCAQSTSCGSWYLQFSKLCVGGNWRHANHHATGAWFRLPLPPGMALIFMATRWDDMEQERLLLVAAIQLMCVAEFEGLWDEVAWKGNGEQVIVRLKSSPYWYLRNQYYFPGYIHTYNMCSYGNKATQVPCLVGHHWLHELEKSSFLIPWL